MTLEEAIQHCEEVAKERCDACGAEHKQLAKWMRELKFRRKAMNWMARNVGEIFGESLIEAAKSISASVRRRRAKDE